MNRTFLPATAALAYGFISAGGTCPPATGDPNGNYMTGSIGDVEYGGGMTLDTYAPDHKPPPFAVLIHGAAGDISTHMTQLFAALERAGCSWLSVNYRSAPDIRTAGNSI